MNIQFFNLNSIGKSQPEKQDSKVSDFLQNLFSFSVFKLRHQQQMEQQQMEQQQQQQVSEHEENSTEIQGGVNMDAMEVLHVKRKQTIQKKSSTTTSFRSMEKKSSSTSSSAAIHSTVQTTTSSKAGDA